MQAVNMQQINAIIREVAYRLVKRRTHQPGECPVALIMVTLQYLIDLLTVKPAMLVPLPSVYPIAGSRQAKLVHRLAKGTIRVAFVGTQLDKDSWLHHINTPEGERNVAMPRVRITQMFGMFENNRPKDLSKFHVPRLLVT